MLRSDFYRSQPKTFESNMFGSIQKTANSRYYFSYNDSKDNFSSNLSIGSFKSELNEANALVVNLEGYLYRPSLQIVDSRHVQASQTRGPFTKIDFGSVHLENFVSAFVFILNPSKCDALFKIRHLPRKVKPALATKPSQESQGKLKLPKIQTIYKMIEKKDNNFVDDPSVFFFQFGNGLVKAKSTLIEHLPETALFRLRSADQWGSFQKAFSSHASGTIVPSEESLLQTHDLKSQLSEKTQPGASMGYSNSQNKALKLGLVFKPKTNGFYRSRFKLEVFNGLGVEFVLQGSGNSLAENIQVNY